jgi:hypothetical protein
MKSLYTTRAAARRMAIVFVCAFQLITSLSADNYYWVNGSGAWSDHNNHWATTSGGNVFHDQVPQSMDNVYFDANSFPAGGTVTIDQTIIYCMDMDWTGATGTPSITGPSDKQVFIYGSLKLVAGMTWEVDGRVRFLAFQPGKVIRMSGQTFIWEVYFEGTTDAEWTLLDDFRAGYDVFHNVGILRAAGNSILISNTFYGGGSNAVLDLEASTMIFEQGLGGNFSYAPGNFDSDNSLIQFLRSGYLNCAAGQVFRDIEFLDVPGGSDAGTFTCTNATILGKILFKKKGILNGPATIQEAEFLENGTINGNNTYNALTFSPGKIYLLGPGQTQTINPAGSLNASGAGCGAFVTIMGNGAPANLSKSGGPVTLDWLTMMNVVATGGAAFTATNSVDLGGNTGWTITSPLSRQLYWVGGAGDWNDAAHWSATSAGAGGECPPTAFDDVRFDANSGFSPGDQVNMSAEITYCRDMDWTGVTGDPAVVALPNDQNKRLLLYGSVTLAANMSFGGPYRKYFKATTAGKTIFSGGQTFDGEVYFDGAGGEWILQDAFRAGYDVFHNRGTLRTNNHPLNVSNSWYGDADGGNDAILDLAQSTMTFEAGLQGIFVYTPAHLDADQSHLVFTNGGNLQVSYNCTFLNISYLNGSNQGSFIGNGCIILGKLLFETRGNIAGNNSVFNEAEFRNSGKITSSNTYNTLIFSPGFFYELGSNRIQTITPAGQLQISGQGCDSYVSIRSTQSGQPATISKAGAPVAAQYLILMDISAAGGAAFFAAGSVDLGGNSGWVIAPPPSRLLYWVGGGGNWSDPAHWSSASGGVGGACPPSPFDDVRFDVNSGFSSGDQVDISADLAYCRDMDWTGVIGNPSFISTTPYPFCDWFIYGSVKLDAGMSFSGPYRKFFKATVPGRTIFSAGKSFEGEVTFDGAGGEWLFEDAFRAGYDLFHRNGWIRTQNHEFRISNTFYSQVSPGNNLSGIDLGASDWIFETGLGANLYYPDNNFFGQNANVIFLNGGYINDGVGQGSALRFKNVTFLGTNNGTINGAFEIIGKLLFSGTGYLGYRMTINEAEFLSHGFLNSSGPIGNTFNTLKFSPGKTYTLAPNSTQTITPLGNFIAQGFGGFPIEIKSGGFGQQATLHKDGDPICLDFLYMTDLVATGSGLSYAGANSDDVFNNSGWKFETCPDCFNAPPVSAPVLDPASVTDVQPGEEATLIVTNLPANHEAVWFNSDQSAELYASENNLFQPTINQTTTYYGAVRDKATGCVSAVLSVTICPGGNTLLSITCPVGVSSLQANTSCQAVLGDYTGLATVIGGCPGQQLILNQAPPPGTVVNPGTVAITLTVSNVAGQSATCRFNVTISGGCGGH